MVFLWTCAMVEGVGTKANVDMGQEQRVVKFC